MYNAMVKEAYENIMGFEKGAGVKDSAANFGRGYLDALTAKGVRGVHASRKAIADALPGVDKADIAAAMKGQELGRGAYVKPGAKTIAAYAPIAAAAIGTGVAVKKRHDKKKAQAAQAALEAAETQKEAAENDYLEACAYEEAALEVLAELGYDVDAFAKEASEDYDDGMTAEEMDEAAFNYLAERGYFDED